MEEYLCDYGCGRKAEFYFKVVKKWCCSSNYQQCPKGKELNFKTEEWRKNHSKIMKGHISWNKGKKGLFKSSEENKYKARERMKLNNPMKNHEAVIKNIETRKRNGTTGLGIPKPKYLNEQNSIRMKENNPMKNPETVMKNFKNHTRDKSGPELYLQKLLETLKLPASFIGDGSLFVNGKCPDFIIPNSKKLIEIYDSSFHYNGKIRDNNWIKSRKKELYGYDVLFIDFNIFGKSKNFLELCKVLKSFFNK